MFRPSAIRVLVGIVTTLAIVAVSCAPVAPSPAAAPAPTSLVAPSTKTDVPGVTDTEIVFGNWTALSGPAAAWGVTGRTYDAFAKFVNDQGGINGRKLKAIIEDDGYSATRTVPLVKKMVEQDKVFAIVGGLGTAGGTAVKDYLIQNGVPHLAPSSGSSKWSEPVSPGYYAYQISYTTEARILVKYGVGTLKKKKFGIFYQNDDYGKEGLSSAKAQLAKLGGELVAEVAYDATDTDYSAYALKLKQSGAEAILTWPGVKQLASLLKETAQIGYKPVWLNSATVNDPALIKLAPEESQGAYFLAYLPDPNDPANAGNPAVKEWRENLPKLSKDLPMSNFTLLGWGQMRLFAEIVKRAGKDITRARFETAAQSLEDWQDLATVTYSATDRRGISVGWIAQAKGDSTVKVTDPIKAD